MVHYHFLYLVVMFGLPEFFMLFDQCQCPVTGQYTASCQCRHRFQRHVFSLVLNRLRQLHPLVRCLSEDAVRILIKAFINTRLDYCNSLHFGITDGLISRLQSFQNAAASLVTGVR